MHTLVMKAQGMLPCVDGPHGPLYYTGACTYLLTYLLAHLVELFGPGEC